MSKKKDVPDFPVPPLPLRRLSRGSAGLAALVLVGAHLAVLLMVLLIWVVGWAPVFDDVHWIPATVASVLLVVGVVVTFMALIPWAYDYEKLFSAGAAFVLDRLHYFLLVATPVVGILAVALIWADVRWHHVFGSAAIEAMPDRAATMPIPQDWTPETAGRQDDSFPEEVYEYEQSFAVPESYRFPQLEGWMSSPEWETSFGALQAVDCNMELEVCQAEVVPSPGEKVTYLVEASYRSGTVRVDLEHPVFE